MMISANVVRKVLHASLLVLAFGGCGGGGEESADSSPLASPEQASPWPSPPQSPPPPPLENLPAWVSNLGVGEWFQIPNTAISSVVPSPVPPGHFPDAKVIAWTSFVVDTRTSSVYSVA